MDYKYIVDVDEMMVKEYLEYLGISRRIRRKVRVLDNIYINNQKAKNYYLVHRGDELLLRFEENINENFIPSSLNIEILYEDQWLIIINKPTNIASQPSRKHPTDNVISFLTSYFHEHNIQANIHLVNRLDFSTTGLMIISKSGILHYEMTKTSITKKYICEIEGKMDDKVGIIRLGIDRYPAPSIKRFVSENGKMAITKYQVLKENKTSSILEVLLVTGRTHQIRVHFSYLGHPLIGDSLYGKEKDGLRLHCYSLEWIHPITKETIKIQKYPNWYEGGN